ncbi:MAG: hypothetical protein V8S81_02115 [Oscillospiraceae bacterium]
MKLGTCINWIPGILKSFRALHPGITVEVVSGFCNSQLTAKRRANGAASPSAPVAQHMGITAGSSFTSVDDTSLVALAESGLGFNRPDGKKQANNF